MKGIREEEERRNYQDVRMKGWRSSHVPHIHFHSFADQRLTDEGMLEDGKNAE